MAQAPSERVDPPLGGSTPPCFACLTRISCRVVGRPAYPFFRSHLRMERLFVRKAQPPLRHQPYSGKTTGRNRADCVRCRDYQGGSGRAKVLPKAGFDPAFFVSMPNEITFRKPKRKPACRQAGAAIRLLQVSVWHERVDGNNSI